MKIKLRDGDTELIMVKDGEVIHFTASMSMCIWNGLGEVPAGAWVGTVSKQDGKLVATSSKHFFDGQVPVPPEVLEAVRKKFE